MKKIINGKQYNTGTAKYLGDWDNGYPSNDFCYCVERLYLTKSGNYFLHLEGGPLSMYGETSGNNSSYGEQIRPVTLEQAQSWVEDRLDGEEYERIFGEVKEEEEKISLLVQISPEAKLKLEKHKIETRKTFAEIVEELIMQM